MTPRAVNRGVSAVSGWLTTEERQYAPFVAAAIAFGLLVGFPLGLTVAMARALESSLDGRLPQLLQVHGHVQLFGWFGLFVMGMGYRLVARFTAVKGRYDWIAPATLLAVASGLLLRSIGQTFAENGVFAAMFGLAGALEFSGVALFVAVVLRALLIGRPDEFGYKPFFAAGVIWLAAAMLLNAYLGFVAARESDPILPAGRSAVVAFLLLYGFVSMFVFAVSIRTYPIFFGRERARPSVVTAGLLTVNTGIAIYAATSLWLTYERSDILRSFQSAGFLAAGAGLLMMVVAAGVFGGEPHRLRESARRNMRFVQSGYAWLALAAILQVYAGATALIDDRPVHALYVDAVRHFIAIGFLTTVTIGMAFLVMPALAMRRLARRSARRVAVALLALLHGAAAARGIGSLVAHEGRFSDGYWAMSAGGVLAIAAIALFVAYVLRSPEEPAGEEIALTERR